MSEQEPKASTTVEALPCANTDDVSDLDPSKSKSYAVKAPHVSDGHTFVVTTVITETMSQTMTTKMESPSILTAVPVLSTDEVDSSRKMIKTTETDEEQPCCSSQAIVPLSSSLPSKLLRFHAKRSAQALLRQTEQSQSLDSQFGSDEGVLGTGSSGSGSECDNDCAELFDVPTPTAPPMSPMSSASPMALSDDKLIDVGMGSSIGSEESEEDDELKPLAVDNHMLLHDIELNSPTERPSMSSPPQELQQHAMTSKSAVLSEANLRKHHNHHQQPHHMDNIYLHPNFKYELQGDVAHDDVLEDSPPPAVAPANSPVAESRRVHHSFLTMKKTAESELMDHNKPASIATTANDDAGDDGSELANEIDTLDASLIPSEELASEITEAVEFYFSNESILKDAFLLKHVRRNKEGFVSLKLVSSFKRVRQLTKEWKVVGNAVRRKSKKIEINDVGTKVRRIEPLPNFDETMPSRTIVACNLPLDKLSIEKVSDIFSKCGEIALIRILKPGMAIPVDVRQFMNKYPELQQKECALIEYLESSSARNARHLEGSFQVFEMVAPKKKTGKKAIIQVAAPVARMVENYRYYNDANYERTRGGSFSGVVPHDSDLRFKLKRNNSDFHTKPLPGDMQHHHGHHHSSHYQHHHYPSQTQHSPSHRGSFGEHTHPFQHYQPRGSMSHDSLPMNASSPGNNMNFFAYSPRRYSNTSTISTSTSAALGGGNEGPTVTQALDRSNNNVINNNNNNNNTNSTGISSLQRRLSNCSENNYSGMSEPSRRLSNCSENAPQRRESNCSESCPCSRRVSDFGQNEAYRKTSICSNGSCNGERRFSNGSLQFERTFSNASNDGNGFYRRMSNDFDRKQSIDTQTNLPFTEQDNLVGGGGGGYNVFPRRYSNNFNVNNKLAAYDNAQYINGRRISTDSGYDRRMSFGSEYEGSPRSRTGSFLNSYKHGGGGGGGGVGGGFDYDNQPRSRTGSFLDGSPRSRSGSFAQRAAEALVRTPIGPDGSKGFGTRARKFGQTISPVN